jgi:hypothetical protein
LEFAQGPYDSILGNSYIDTESEVILIPVSGSDYDWEWDPRTGWKKKKRPEGQKPLPPGWFWMLSPFGYIPVEWYIEVPIGKAKDVQPVPQEPEKKQKSWFERVFGKPAKPPPAAPQEPKIAIDEKVKPSDTVTTPEGIAIEHKPSVYELHKQKLNTE